MEIGKSIPEKQRLLPRIRLKIKSALKQLPWWDFLLIILCLLLAIFLRFSLRAIVTSDYEFFGSWYANIQADGYKSLAGNFSNYPPLYLLFLYIVSVIFPHVSPITATKLPSIFFDFICAWYVYRIVRLKYGNSVAASISGLVILFAPTVVINGAAWGQIESIYSAGLLACIYYLLRRKSWLACLAFGLAFAIKLQSIYLVPFLLALCLKKELPWKCLLAIPAVYLVSIIPAWIAGRPFTELLTIYATQVGGYEGLVHNATSLYTWLPLADYKTWYLPGVIFAGAICLLYVYLIVRSQLEALTPHLVKLALASLLIVPFFLPKTHDRYFFPADVLSIAFGFYYPNLFFVPILINLTSFFIYQPYLFGVDIFPQSVLTLAMFVAISIVIWQTIVQLFPKNPAIEQ
jgi:Gpi18-like mannosyltransferase